MMTPADLVELYWNICWNERRPDRLGEVFHDPYTQGEVEGPLSRLESTIEEGVASSADCRIEIRSMHEQDELVITRTLITGTHTGPLFGIDGTGKVYRVPMLDAFFFRDGKVELYLHLADHLPILAALEAEIRVGEQLAKLD
jgi:predicted ester cyclase